MSAKWVHFIPVVAHITHRFSRKPFQKRQWRQRKISSKHFWKT